MSSRRTLGSTMMAPSSSSNSTVHGATSHHQQHNHPNTTSTITNVHSVSSSSSSSSSSINVSHRQHLLRQLVQSTFVHSPISALFYAERLHALDTSHEPSVYSLALALMNNTRFHEAIWLLRQTVTFNPSEHQPSSSSSSSSLVSNSNNNNNNEFSNPFNIMNMPSTSTTTTTTNKRWPANARITKPSIEASLRCARLYAQACTYLGRHKEAREVLAKIISTTQPLIQPDPFSTTLESALPLFSSATTTTTSSDSSWAIDLELARSAKSSNETERAIQSYRKALEKNPWCWEALESLSRLGSPPDPDSLYPLRPMTKPATNVPLSPITNDSAFGQQQNRPALASHPSHPPPLGPSQNSLVNSFTNNSSTGPISKPPLSSIGGFFTPTDAASPMLVAGGAGGLGGNGQVAKGKEVRVGNGGGLFGLGGGAAAVSSIWRKTRGGNTNNIADLSEMSMEDSSFDTSFYPQPLNLHHNAQASSSNSLFTPPATVNLTSSNAVVPGVKRTRGGVQSQATSSMLTPSNNQDEEMKPFSYAQSTATTGTNKRVVRGVPPAENVSKHRRDSSIGHSHPSTTTTTNSVTGNGTRRSSRLSRDAGSSSNGISSVSMALTRSQLSANGGGAATTRSASARDKKRSKAGAGPSVLSDAGSETALSPVSLHSSSPAPSSPGASNHQQQQSIGQQQSQSIAQQNIDPFVQEAEDYLTHVVRCFAFATTGMAKYESAKSIEALLSLPVEQQRTWRCMIGIAKAHFELLNYEKAEKAFSQARQLAPHLLESMELYSTLLWHLRLSTQLSFLAQDLMLVAPRSSSAWIASGNVFSHLEDHGSALQCFKRAAQLDPSCVYAYTLSGHECVVLEEWERALTFFREAIRMDRRHYNAWFGLGNVYLHTGKYRLAEYHFRQATIINPSNATLLCCVGSVLEKLGRRREALQVYEKAVEIAPDSPAVRFKRVRILLHLKKFELAENDLLNLKDRAPNEFNVHFLLGKLYKVTGRKNEMLRHFALAQDLEPRTASLIRDQVERDSIEREMDVDESES